MFCQIEAVQQNGITVLVSRTCILKWQLQEYKMYYCNVVSDRSCLTKCHYGVSITY